MALAVCALNGMPASERLGRRVIDARCRAYKTTLERRKCRLCRPLRHRASALRSELGRGSDDSMARVENHLCQLIIVEGNRRRSEGACHQHDDFVEPKACAIAISDFASDYIILAAQHLDKSCVAAWHADHRGDTGEIEARNNRLEDSLKYVGVVCEPRK